MIQSKCIQKENTKKYKNSNFLVSVIFYSQSPPSPDKGVGLWKVDDQRKI